MAPIVNPEEKLLIRWGDWNLQDWKMTD